MPMTAQRGALLEACAWFPQTVHRAPSFCVGVTLDPFAVIYHSCEDNYTQVPCMGVLANCHT